MPRSGSQYRPAMSDFTDVSSATESEEMTDSVHSFYNDPQADIVLRSSDRVLFKVHSVLFRLASDVFAGMVSMPRSPTESSEVVQVKEDADIISALLDVIYPRRPIPKLASFSFVSRLAEAADKYDIVDATSLIRGRILGIGSSTLPLPGSPLE